MSVDTGVGYVDGGVHRPLAQANENTVPAVTFLTTSASPSRRPASAAWKAKFESLMLATIFSCISVLLSADTPITASTKRNISAGKSDIPDWEARGGNHDLSRAI